MSIAVNRKETALPYRTVHENDVMILTDIHPAAGQQPAKRSPVIAFVCVVDVAGIGGELWEAKYLGDVRTLYNSHTVSVQSAPQAHY